MTLTEKTSIPIGIALALFGGGAAWMTNIAMQNDANAKSLSTMETRHYDYLRSIQKIEKDVEVIKTKLELMHSNRSTERE